MELLVKNLTKQYDGKPVINNLNFALENGVYALLGPNGSGKTTLLRMICGILHPTSGDILLDNINITSLGEDYRTLLGYLPQNFGYYPNFSGLDFLLYFSALKNLPKYTAEEETTRLLNLLGLYNVRNKKLKTYSGGMLQRIGIAQALLNNPKILILDEPTSGLDPKERTHFRNIIDNLSKDRIILLSTHIVSDVAYISDKVMLIKEGSLLLNESADIVNNILSGHVWELVTTQETAKQLSNQYIISSIHHVDDAVELRIISELKPLQNAINVNPTLEDLYLYYFREEAQNELN